jgi:hypothetical protein
MKYGVILISLILGLSACTNNKAQLEQKNIQLVKNYIKAVENLDYDAMSNYLDDDYIGMGPSYGDSINKTDAVDNWSWSSNNLYEKIKYDRSRFAAVTIPDGDNAGNWVANWAELTITYKDDFGEAIIWANTNYMIKNNKIIRSFTFYNEADVLRQIGYKIVPDGDF